MIFISKVSKYTNNSKFSRKIRINYKYVINVFVCKKTLIKYSQYLHFQKYWGIKITLPFKRKISEMVLTSPFLCKKIR